MDWFNTYLLVGIIVYGLLALATFIALARRVEGSIPLSFLFLAIFWLPVYLYYVVTQRRVA